MHAFHVNGSFEVVLIVMSAFAVFSLKIDGIIVMPFLCAFVACVTTGSVGYLLAI